MNALPQKNQPDVSGSSLTLTLLGEFSLVDHRGSETSISSKKNRALLGILALSSGQAIPRERLANLLWGDRGEEQARSSLRQSLAVLRKELGLIEDYLILSKNENLALEQGKLKVDALQFIAASLSDDPVTLRAAASLSHGELFFDHNLREESFEEWLANQRRTINDAALRLFTKLVEQETGAAQIEAATRLVAVDPLREASQRHLMQAYANSGERGQALKQYEKCRELLRLELGIEPAAETRNLKDHIAEGRKSPFNADVQGSIQVTEPLYVSALANFGQSVSPKLVLTPVGSSIAVLPFVDMGGDGGHEFFAEGLTADIITDLSNAQGLFVIAHNSTMAYKGKPTDVRQIAHDLGVKYILEGSARRTEKRVRINVQLSDASNGGNYVWAERFDRDLANIFELQDEVARRVVDAISGKLNGTASVERYRPIDIEAYDLCVRSRNQWAISKTANDETKSYLLRAIALDPNYCEAHWQLANALIFGWLIWGDPPEPGRRKALELAQRAVDIDPQDSTARSTLGYILLNDRRWDDAELQYDEALRLNPNNADAYADAAYFYVIVGKREKAVEAASKAMRLNPRPPGWYYWITGTALVASGQYENAVAILRREETYRSASRRMLATALALLGRSSEAHAEAKLFLATSSHWRISSWVVTQPFKTTEDAAFWIEAFRLAGLPE